MPHSSPLSRRGLLTLTGSAAAAAIAGNAPANPAAQAAQGGKVFRIGVISAAILGKPQPRNGHNWHFAQYLHPDCDWDAFKKHYPAGFKDFHAIYRNPKFGFDQLPFPDSRITHYYDA